MDENLIDAATAAGVAVGGALEDDVVQRSVPDYPDADVTHDGEGSLCSAVSSLVCTDGMRAADYDGCSLETAGATLTGSSEIDYSRATCHLSSPGDTLARKSHSVTMTLSSGAISETTTDDVSDYLGDQFGSSGSIITMKRGEFTLAILMRKTLQRADDTYLTYDLTERTPPGEPLIIRGGLSRKSRKVKSGTLIIYHNLARFTATHHLSNVAWGDPSCCFPMSGQSDMTFTGALNGTATIQFGPSCGEYVVTRNGDQKVGKLTVCNR